MRNAAEIMDGKKFMWDQEDYSTEADAKKKLGKYEKDGFKPGLSKKKVNFLFIRGGL